MANDDRNPLFVAWEERDRQHYRGKERDILIWCIGGTVLWVAVGLFVMFAMAP